MLGIKIYGYESLVGGTADWTAGTAEVADWFWLLLCQSLSPQFVLQKKKIREKRAYFCTNSPVLAGCWSRLHWIKVLCDVMKCFLFTTCVSQMNKQGNSLIVLHAIISLWIFLNWLCSVLQSHMVTCYCVCLLDYEISAKLKKREF